MNPDYQGALDQFFSVVDSAEVADHSLQRFQNCVGDGMLLNKFLKNTFPWYFLSFSGEDSLFHGAFVFVRVCQDLNVPESLIPDAFEIMQGAEIGLLLQCVEYLASLDPPEKGHSGPRLEESDSSCSSCLVCRWKRSLHILLPEAHSGTSIPLSTKRLLEEGVPSLVRESVWLYLSGGLRLVRARRPDYRCMFPSALENSEYIELIDLDVSRTFVDEPDWRLKKYDVIVRRILAAYAKRNKTVGYCQGLSYIVGVLATVCNEEAAFVILCAIIEDGLLPLDNYTNLQGAVVDREVLDRLVVHFIPELVDQLDGGPLGDYTFISVPWHMCLFSSTLSRPCAMRLWDFLFAFGPCVLFRISLGILNELSRRMGSVDLGEVRELLRKIEHSLDVADLTIFASHQFLACDNALVDRVRAKVRKDAAKPSLPLTVKVFPPQGQQENFFGQSVSTPPSVSSAREQRFREKSVLNSLAGFMGQQ